jgi:hypothetical protein
MIFLEPGCEVCLLVGRISRFVRLVVVTQVSRQVD